MIRTFKTADSKKVKALITEISSKEFKHGRAPRYEDLEDISKTYGGKKDLFLVCEDKHEIVGTAALKEDAPHVGLLRRVFVASASRQKGYGQRMLTRVLEFAHEHGYQRIMFRCTDDMVGALSLVVKKGFHKAEEIDMGSYKVLVMEKKLS